MKMLEKNTAVQSLVDRLSPVDTATLAGEVLGNADPSLENLEAFWNALPANVANEIVERVMSEELSEREDSDDDEDEDDKDDDKKD